MSRHFAPAAERNKTVIAKQLARVLPTDGLVLEIASGTGQHVAHFARELPTLTFQPSDIASDTFKSMQGHVAEAQVNNVLPPIVLDAASADWPAGVFDGVLCINMVHISPWDACLGLLAGASQVLTENGVLVMYGPYAIDGVLAPESNVRFDNWLKSRDPNWGVRELRDIERAAADKGLSLTDRVAMPANNWLVTLTKRS